MVVPWLFGPTWEPAVTATQILVIGGAATLAINTCGSALMAAGRAKALLGYGVAHFVVYVGAVLAVAHLGIAAVAIAGSVVHGIFLLVAYEVLLRDEVESPLRVLWQDLSPALSACAALALAAVGANRGLDAVGAPTLPLIVGVCAAGGLAYILALRTLHPDSARDLVAALRRLLPERLGFARRLGAAVPAES